MKAKPNQTKDQLKKELSKCNRKLKNERRHANCCEEQIQELKKENRVMTRAQRSQQNEMDKLNIKHSALKRKLDKKEDYIVAQNRNHWQKTKENRLFFCQQREQQKKDCNKKVETMERKYKSKLELAESNHLKRIAVVESCCAEMLESTRVECVKLTSLFKNALVTEKKKNSKQVGELEAEIKSQSNEFRI